MPEGHTLHRLAAEHTALFAGRKVTCGSPQGRFADGARALNSRILKRVEAYGKHWFAHWSGGAILHVHLGLYGKFVTHEGAAPAPGPNVRLRMSAAGAAVDLTGPTACELVDPGRFEHIMARLGPDLLRPGADREAVWAALHRTRRPLGAVLLDQSVLAGIGNVFRAEALFVERLDPCMAAAGLERAGFDGLWATLTGMLADGVKRGRIQTVPNGDLPREEPPGPGWGRWVYRRAGEPCRICRTPVRAWKLAARTIYACPCCQSCG